MPTRNRLHVKIARMLFLEVPEQFPSFDAIKPGHTARMHGKRKKMEKGIAAPLADRKFRKCVAKCHTIWAKWIADAWSPAQALFWLQLIQTIRIVLLFRLFRYEHQNSTT